MELVLYFITKISVDQNVGTNITRERYVFKKMPEDGNGASNISMKLDLQSCRKESIRRWKYS